MSAQPINGRAVAKRINAQTQQLLSELDFVPGLGVVLIGDDPASQLYVNLKEKACRKMGLNFFRHELPSGVTQPAALLTIEELNRQPLIHGMIVQLPLPPQLDTNEIIAAMDPAKDADGFHLLNLKRTDIQPVLPAAVLELLKATGEPLTNLTAAVVAKSTVLFNQVARVLQTVGIQCDHFSPADLEKTADYSILITAVGQPKLIRAQHVRHGAIVIDIGTTRVGDKVCGDVDAESVSAKASWLTPVPGGVGPVTVAMLIHNVVKLAKKSQMPRYE
ncbi:MAG: bifunctional 5,10-methylenetetrahydrofolate dehydrogenase/5,10-methenyltetrahydrofolate cyclohydrolase [Patescibacteria group bacterium]